MPDEAIYAQRARELWQHGSLPLFHGEGAGYGVLYPIVAGGPLVAGGLGTLKVVQAFLMSLSAVPVFRYGRRIAPPAYAVIAATLTLASPLLLYSGLVMTEVLFYPVAALALLAAARSVQTASARDQAVALALIMLAVLTRVQAVVFVAVLGLAALLDCLARRDAKRITAFRPTWAALGTTALAGVAVPGVFGAYAGTLSGTYPWSASLRLAYEHLAYLILATGVLPVASLFLLLADTARGRERDPAARALVLVTSSAILAVCAQVGLFSARFAPHLLGRDLASLPPLLFLVFALYLSRVRRRSWRIVTGACFAVLAIVALAPWDEMTVATALPDSFGLGLVYRLSSSVDAANLVTIGALAALALLGVVSVVARRFALALPLVVLAFFVATAIATTGVIVPQARDQEARLVGTPRNWVDRSAKTDVTYIYDGEPDWDSVWQQRFWNERIVHVLSLPPARVPGPMPQTLRAPSADGGLATHDRYVVAPDRFEFIGTPVAHHLRGPDLAALTLWRLDGPPRLSMSVAGIDPNGDMIRPATLTVYDCAGGRLELTLLPKATDVVTVQLDGRTVLRRRIAGLPSWHGTVPVPYSHRGICRFTIHGGLLLGSTVLAFVRP